MLVMGSTSTETSGGEGTVYLALLEAMMAGTEWMNCSSPLMVCSLSRANSFIMWREINYKHTS